MADGSPTHKSWFEKISHLIHREPQSRNDLTDILRAAKDSEILDNDDLRMLQGVLQVAEMQVRDVMIPRPQMVVIDKDDDPKETIAKIITSTHSRFPVMGNSQDEIIGILLAKDLLRYIDIEQNKRPSITELIRPATFIPESKRLNMLLKEFRLKRNHMAIVVDEYGGIAGLVTIEDVLEQIVGDIVDEFDVEETEAPIKSIKPNVYQVNALTPIEDFNDYFKTSFEHEDYDTIGGLLLHNFSHLPKQGESITLDELTFTIIQATNRGIQTIKVTKRDV